MRPELASWLMAMAWGCGVGAGGAWAELPASSPSSRPSTLPGSGKAPPGLSVDRGVLMKDGRAYRGIGVNYFSAFIRTLSDSGDVSYRSGLAALRERGIPFIRFACNGFWAADWSLYLRERPRYFERLDAFVQEAERQGIGLIPSFFWYFATVPDAAGEPVDQWGHPASKTHTLMRQYVADVVGRYRDSPAIWAWEFGNEHRLQIDLPGAGQGLPYVAPQLGTPTTRSARDKLPREAVECAQREFGRAVRRIDAHRLLITGDSIPRPFAYHLMTGQKWERDTPAQTAAMLLRDNADPYDGLSIHLYPNRDHEFFEPPAPLRELLRMCHETGIAAGKPLFVGEFGASDEMGPEQVRVYVRQMLETIVELRIPLAALWVYDLPQQDGTYNVTAENHRSWMLDAVAEANRRMRGR